MAEIQAAIRTTWGDATPAQAALRTTWGDAAHVQSVGGALYVPPEVPGGLPVMPGGLAPQVDIPERVLHEVTHSMLVYDLRAYTGEPPVPLPVRSGSLALQQGSALWELRAEGDASLYETFRNSEQPPLVAVRINGQEWHCVVEGIEQPQAFASSSVSFSGRSLAALADAPYQPVETYITDAPTTAAQLATLAQTFTGLDVQWQAPDWLIPAGAWSYQGTPLGVVGQVAAAIEAVVEAQRDGPALLVQPRYPVQPNLWATTPPDWQIHHSAIERSNSVRADTPEYNAVLVAGQQQGGVLTARYAGTSGAVQAPLVTDPLLTDGPALLERAGAILASAGKKADVSRTLQVGPEGVVPRGALVRFVDPDETWTGLVRSVAVQFSFGQARQTIGVERRTAFQSGVFAPPVEPNREVLIDFDLLGDVVQVVDFYAGGRANQGANSPNGPDYGVYFRLMSTPVGGWAGTTVRQTGGEVTSVENTPSPENSLQFFNTPAERAFINCPGGFDKFGVWFASPSGSGELTFYSEVDGGGVPVGTLAIPQTGAGPNPNKVFGRWLYAEAIISGIAKSVGIGTARTVALFDDFRLRLVQPPRTPAPVPPPVQPPLIPTPFLNLTAPSPASGPATVAAAGGRVVAVGTTAGVPFSLSATAGATVAPATGTAMPGVPVAYTVTPAAAGLVQISVTNTAGLPNAPAVNFTATAAPPPPPPPPPTITVQPASVTVTAPASATFSVTATGTGPLSYQWRRGGVNISGATSASYTLSPTATSDNAAVFSVVVANAGGSTTSGNATLTVNAAPAGSFDAVFFFDVWPNGSTPAGNTSYIQFLIAASSSAAALSVAQGVTGWFIVHPSFSATITQSLAGSGVTLLDIFENEPGQWSLFYQIPSVSYAPGTSSTLPSDGTCLVYHNALPNFQGAMPSSRIVSSF